MTGAAIAGAMEVVATAGPVMYTGSAVVTVGAAAE